MSLWSVIQHLLLYATGAFSSDFDGDGYRNREDCAPADPLVYPGALERCNGVDDDCDGTVMDETGDADGDGYAPCGGDCDDRAAAVHPGAVDEAGDGKDADCDGEDG